MESSKVVFERTLTDLEPLQSPSHLRYMLDDVHIGVRRYGVRISQSMRDRVDEARCAALCTTWQQCHFLPVSYTHLDVYKRQDKQRLRQH